MKINRRLDLKPSHQTAKAEKLRNRKYILLWSVCPLVVRVVGEGNERQRNTLRRMAKSLVCIKHGCIRLVVNVKCG